MEQDRIYVIGGGTVTHVRPHLAIAAPAYGKLATLIYQMVDAQVDAADVRLCLTKMADCSSHIETSDQLRRHIEEFVIGDPRVKMAFMTAAVCDFDGRVGDEMPWGKSAPRLDSKSSYLMRLLPAPKILPLFRKTRKDLFLVACKTTAGASPDDQFLAGLKLLKENSCNLVLANDIHTKMNMIVTPEESRYCVTNNREAVVSDLVQMALARSKGTFTRSTVEPGDPVPWNSELVPASLRKVVDYLISRGAYKAYSPGGPTAGHFAVKIGEGEFLTSRRKTDFNKLNEVGLVRVIAKGDNNVTAFGGSPSVGGQSQRIVFAEHPDADCIVHAHIPLKKGTMLEIPVRPQWQNECGSHQCGKNTSEGLRKFGNLYAVMLDNHGPNIVFHRNTDPAEIIRFIESNFDLDQKTDGIYRPYEPRSVAEY